MPIVGIHCPLACTECLTEVRGRFVQSEWFGFVSRGNGAAVEGGDGAASGGRGGHVGAQCMAGGAIADVVLFVSW